MIVFAHAGHWLTSVAYFLPVVGFVVWLAIVQIRERRSPERGRRDSNPRPPA